MNGPTSIAVLGGSSAFMPSLAAALGGEADDMPDLDVRLVGRNMRRCDAVARFCNLLAQARGWPHRYVGTTNVRSALDGVSVVLNQIRVGGFPARSADIQLALSAGLPGDETIGPSGLASAVRSWPVVARLAHQVEQHAPDAHFVQLGNPMAMLLGGLYAETGLRAFGLCELPLDTICRALGLVTDVDVSLADIEYVGLNHQGWFVRVELDGHDLLPEIFDAIRLLPGFGFFRIEVDRMREYGGLPLHYLRLIMHRERELAKQRAATQDRGAELDALARSLFDVYERAQKADLTVLGARDMPWNAMTIAPAVRALLGGRATTAFVSSANDAFENADMVEFLPPSAVVERECVISSTGPERPRVTRTQISRAIQRQLVEIARFESLGSAAAMRPTLDSVARALEAHPFPIEASIPLAERILIQSDAKPQSPRELRAENRRE